MTFRGGDNLKSKLDKLAESGELMGTNVVNYDNGIMISEYGDAATFVLLEYEDYFEVYLSLYDEGEPPYRDILVTGTSMDVEDAMKIASRNLSKEYKKLIH